MSGERPDWMTDDLIDAASWEETMLHGRIGSEAVEVVLLAAHAHTPLVPAARLAEVEQERDRWRDRAIRQRDRASVERGQLRDGLRLIAAGNQHAPSIAKVTLSSVEGEAPAPTPTEEPCDACGGTGGHPDVPCPRCGGSGRRPVEGEEASDERA